MSRRLRILNFVRLMMLVALYGSAAADISKRFALNMPVTVIIVAVTAFICDVFLRKIVSAEKNAEFYTVMTKILEESVNGIRQGQKKSASAGRQISQEIRD